ncbi:MAG: hypothetical protein RLZZ28_808 [Bacteroidota bacterium]|jgi:uncharacterized membrane protein YqaE (UPF0057 family)
MKKTGFYAAIIGLVISSQAMASIDTDTKNAATVSRETPDALINEAVVMDAMHEFRSLSRVDRKMRMSELKKTIKEYKEAQKGGKADGNTNTLLLAILAILLPPLAVYLHEGTINGKFWLSLLLTLCFWIPGVIYALIVVL